MVQEGGTVGKRERERHITARFHALKGGKEGVKLPFYF
jgi:hypothetical protein